MSIEHLNGLHAISIDLIKPSPNNPRAHLVDIDDLALSIRENGLIQPIVVQRIPGEPKVQIVAGHRRYAAVRRLGWPKVPCIVRRDMLPDEELLAMLVENGQRAGLDPIEEARAYKRLEDTGLTQLQIATKVGRSVNTISSRLLLLQLPAAEQEEIRAGHINIGRGIALVRDKRRQERQAASPVARPIGRPKGAKTKPYFGDTHPLADTARTRCNHTGTPKIAGVACGPCIEAVIREDERQKLGGPTHAQVCAS